MLDNRPGGERIGARSGERIVIDGRFHVKETRVQLGASNPRG